MRRFIAIAVPTMLLAGCLAEDPEDIDLQFRPPKPPCPNCSIKNGSYTIPPQSAFPSGYTITAARLTHNVEYESHCPAPPASEDPPCERSGAISVLPAVWDQSYEEPLIFATDWGQGDEESALVELTLSKSGSPDIVERLAVSIDE